MKRWQVIFVGLFAGAACVFTACKQEDTSVIDESYLTTTPHIAAIAVNADSLNTGNLPPAGGGPDDSVTISITVTLTLSADTPPASITTAFVKVFSPAVLFLKSVTLHNDGVAPDVTAGDAIYSAGFGLKIPRKEIGAYQFSAVVANTDGNSASRSASITIRNSSNHPPVVSNLIAPDTVLKPPAGVPAYKYTFSVQASDPEGLDDITNVYANIINISGQQTGSFNLYDDGDTLHGDAVAGDGIFSRIFRTDSTTTQNTQNTFLFFATDRSNAVSDTIKKIIYNQ